MCGTCGVDRKTRGSGRGILQICFQPRALGEWGLSGGVHGAWGRRVPAQRAQRIGYCSALMRARSDEAWVSQCDSGRVWTWDGLDGPCARPAKLGWQRKLPGPAWQGAAQGRSHAGMPGAYHSRRGPHLGPCLLCAPLEDTTATPLPDPPVVGGGQGRSGGAARRQPTSQFGRTRCALFAARNTARAWEPFSGFQSSR